MAKENSKHIKSKNNKKHYNKSNSKIAFVVVLIFIITLFIYSKNKVKPIFYNTIQVILNNENITENMSDKVVNENNQIYMSFDDVQKFLDNTIYFEEETNTFITTSSKKLASIKEDEDNITINGSTLKMDKPIIEIDGKKYIAISEMENVYDYECKLTDRSNIVTIDSLNKKQEIAKMRKSAKLKDASGFFSKAIEKLSKDEEIIYIENIGYKAKIRTQNGNIGYVKYNTLKDIETIREDFIEKSEEQQSDQYFEYDLTDKDITTFEKRQNIINLILQQTIKNGKMYVKLIYNNDAGEDIERFKIEVKPMLKECGITVLL